jgi:hypothetical protein
MVRHHDTWIKPSALEPCIQVEHPTTGRKLTLGFKNGKFILKANPISWLTGQNFFGTNNAHLLVMQVLRELLSLNLLRVQRPTLQRWSRGEYDIHQMAFNMYLRVDEADKLLVADYLKTIFGGVASHMDHRLGQQYMLYSGSGFIIKTKTQTLCVYDKIVEQVQKGFKLPARIRDLLLHHLRVESTIKYGYFTASRRRMSAWLTCDWDKEARRIIQTTVDLFNLDYLASCPNVFDPRYASSWTAYDKDLFASWLSGKDLSARHINKLKRLYGFVGSFPPNAHANTLHTLTRSKRPLTSSNLKFPGHVLLASILPTSRHLTVLAPPKLLANIDEKCGLS